jgi:hypothetical protein
MEIMERKVPIPIYFGYLKIIITESYDQISKKYEMDIDDETYSGVFFYVKENDEYVIAIREVNWSVIAHEIVHCVNEIFINRGIQLDRHNDEPQAYLTGWITNQVDKFLKEKQINK